MRVRFTSATAADIDDAWRWYASRSAEIAGNLLDDIVAARTLIEEFPRGWTLLGSDVRRCSLKRFPYGLVYVIGTDEIVVVGFGHLQRGPRYWRDMLRRRDQAQEPE